MAIAPGDYTYVKSDQETRWRHAKGEPEGVEEVVLHKHEDGSYTHIMRVKKGVEFREPVKHDFYEEAYYLEGEMINTKTEERIEGGAYVFHEPGEEHGPFKCLKTCLILEFRYYR